MYLEAAHGFFATGCGAHCVNPPSNPASVELDALSLYPAAPALFYCVFGVSVLLRHLYQPVRFRFSASGTPAVRRAAKLRQPAVQPRQHPVQRFLEGDWKYRPVPALQRPTAGALRTAAGGAARRQVPGAQSLSRPLLRALCALGDGCGGAVALALRAGRPDRHVGATPGHATSLLARRTALGLDRDHHLYGLVDDRFQHGDFPGGAPGYSRYPLRGGRDRWRRRRPAILLDHNPPAAPGADLCRHDHIDRLGQPIRPVVYYDRHAEPGDWDGVDHPADL